MADPTKYTKGYSFEGYQANNPSKPLPAPRLDDELENISSSIDETIDALKDIRRSDGALQNGVVTSDAVAPALLARLGNGLGGVLYADTFSGVGAPSILTLRPISDGSDIFSLSVTTLGY